MIKNRAIQGIRSWKKLLLSVWLLLSLYPWMTLTAATGAALSDFHDCFMMTGTLLQQVFVVYQKFFPVMAAGCSAYYLSRKRDGCVVLSAVVAYLTLTTVLNADILNEAFYYLKYDVEYDISMTERPRLRPVSEKQETITPENETILLFSFYFRHILPYAMLHK